MPADAAPPARSLIVNADDLGWSAPINAGIFQAAAEGIVTSATLAANMPAAEEALAGRAAVPHLGVGIHLNACQGPAMSAAGRSLLAGAGGRMNSSAARLLGRLALRPRRLGAAIEAEFDAQIRWCLARGLRPSHLDTHRHLHAWPGVFRIVAALARRYDVTFVRRHGEPAAVRRLPRGPASQRRLSRALTMLGGYCHARWGRGLQPAGGTLGVSHTGCLDVAVLLAMIDALPAGLWELMTHPGWPDGLTPAQTRLRESRRDELRGLCDERLRDRLRLRGVTLTNYARLASTT